MQQLTENYRQARKSQPALSLEEILRQKFEAQLRKTPTLTDNQFIQSLSEEELLGLYDLATNRLLTLWRGFHARPPNNNRHRRGAGAILQKIPPYFNLDQISPIAEKPWGDLSGTEWGTIGSKGLIVRQLLGPAQTAFELVGKTPGYNDRFNGLLATKHRGI